MLSGEKLGFNHYNYSPNYILYVDSLMTVQISTLISVYIECTGTFHVVFSVGGDSFYVGVQRGDGGKTYFYHTNNQDMGLIRPGRGNRFICSEEGR